MYRLIIVDDEELELEGMSQLVPWNRYNAEVVGTAENGQKGLDIIHEQKPDIVITDIQMPVMNGMEMIARLREEENPAEIIVLSGYGDYEYTSKAMEYGIRHYLMKPFDEEKIASVMEAVENEIMKKISRASYDDAMRKLLPKAKEQVFRDILLNRSTNNMDYRLLLGEIGNADGDLYLIAFRKMKSLFDDLEQFVTGNILGELLGKENVFLSTQIRNDLLYLVRVTDQPYYDAVQSVLKTLGQLDQNKIIAAVSRNGKTEDAALLYEQVEHLYRMRHIFEGEAILSYDVNPGMEDYAKGIFHFREVQESDDYNWITCQVFLGYLKMQAHDYNMKQMKELSIWFTGLFLDEDEIKNVSAKAENVSSPEDLYKIVAESIARKKEIYPTDKESLKMQSIMYAAFDNLNNPGLNTKYISNEVLYMNEDYFSRLYLKLVGERFSVNLNKARIWFVKQLIDYDPDLRLNKIAELVGFAPDGQYLSRIFRKQEGMTPSEYRELVKTKKSDLSK